MNLRWRITGLGTTPGRRPEDDGVLVDEDVSVGRVMLNPRHPEPNAPDQWFWAMQATYRDWDNRQNLSGRAETKEEAKAEVERLYAAFCEVPGAREWHLKHGRQINDRAEAWDRRQRPV